LRFEEDFPNGQVVRLSRNYRCSAPIVRGSTQVVVAGNRANSIRTAPRAMQPAQQGLDDRIDIHEAATDRAEAEFIVHTMEELIGGHSFFSVDSGRSDGVGAAELSFSDFAVLYRSEAQAELICEALDRSGMPYQRRSHDMLLDRPAVRELVEATRRLGACGPVLQRLRRAASTLMQPNTEDTAANAAKARCPWSPEVVHTAMELLEPLAEQCGDDGERFEHELALGAEIDSWDPRADRIALLTLHAAKGLEFAVVFIAGCEDGILPLRFGELSEIALAEERRLLYVGMTRARERLVLCHARKRRWRGQVRPAKPSPFLRAIEEQLVQRSQTRAPRQRADDTSEQLDLF
jgi:DNA helicase-2/ATP-dependent DNA helicase PcrA